MSWRREMRKLGSPRQRQEGEPASLDGWRPGQGSWPRVAKVALQGGRREACLTVAHSAGQTPDPCLISAAAPPLRPNHRLEPDGRDRGARPSGGSPAPLWPRRLARHITCRPLCTPPRHWPGQVSRRVAPSGIGCATGCWLATLLLFFSSLSPLSPLAVYPALVLFISVASVAARRLKRSVEWACAPGRATTTARPQLLAQP